MIKLWQVETGECLKTLKTDVEIDKELEEMGISKKEIVVGFHHPSTGSPGDTTSITRAGAGMSRVMSDCEALLITRSNSGVKIIRSGL